MNNERKSIIGAYTLTHIKTNKVYVGSSNDFVKRKNNHLYELVKNKHKNKELQKAFNDDQELKFFVYIANNREYAYELEQELINSLKPTGVLFNIAQNAKIPFKDTVRTEEHNAKIGKAHKGKIVSEETREKLSLLAIERMKDPVRREKIRQAQTGRKHTPERIEKNRLNGLGRKHTPETIEKCRLAKLGKKRTPESIEKQRQANIGKKRSPEAIEKSAAKRRGIPLSDEHKAKIKLANMGHKYYPKKYKA